ncbi:TIGR03768 family metallophosphoesterase [uncultured Thiodictyon sp.]|uniref:TIGR03768 family metallophosphoesterase n=1 Tax=uncultured Thiodictyon sp. TaxID=1846217 RepID=UPI0025DE8E6B|nr:TIGR03768 family metallophosphoesterase [uncultured Thiodictyon sp.]
MSSEDSKKSGEASVESVTRREFLKYSTGTLSALALYSLPFGAVRAGRKVQRYPIRPQVATTLEAMISFPTTLPGLSKPQICEVDQYTKFGYGNWTLGSPRPLVPRTDIMPAHYGSASAGRKVKFIHFFSFSDIPITDKEAPNQLIHFQQIERFAYNNTSIYSPVMMYTTHVLDAAVQTVNALHKKNRFDFGLSLGDTCNSTSYNELCWYLDVIDGKVITPSSGAHLGTDSIEYQKPYQAAGLDRSIPWYQTMGNHDHFYLGSFPVAANPALGFRQSYVADSVWSMADILVPNLRTFPVLFNIDGMAAQPRVYTGVIDGSSPFGKIIQAGPATDAAFAAGAPKVAADPDRRSLVRTEWKQEFFRTTTHPVGHGFHLAGKDSPPGFACYSFIPNPKVPLRVIVLDDTQREDEGSTDIHGHGYLDAQRWAWLQAELARGQADNQLMIADFRDPPEQRLQRFHRHGERRSGRRRGNTSRHVAKVRHCGSTNRPGGTVPFFSLPDHERQRHETHLHRRTHDASRGRCGQRRALR